MPFQTPITIERALERIQKGEYVLPAIQREFAWSTDQVVRLFDSLMRKPKTGDGTARHGYGGGVLITTWREKPASTTVCLE